jgi:DNA polymerase III delta prime subunit
VCAACIKAAGGNHPDIVEIEGVGASHLIAVDAVRALREQAYVLPNEAARRVFIIVGAQDMNEAAQNALLKVLEEPPAQAAFVLTCENRSQLLPTVQSRCVCHTLSGVSPEEALPVLRAALPAQSEDELVRALAVFGGCIGQVIRGVEDGAFARVLELVPQLAQALVAPGSSELLLVSAGLEKEKEVADGVLTSLSLLVRDALAVRLGGVADTSADRQAAEALARSLSPARLMAVMQAIERLQTARRRNMNPSLFSVYLCAQLRAAVGK